MKYKIAQLAKIIDGDRGVNYPKQNEFQDEGYCLFLDAGNVTINGFSFDSNQFISERKHHMLHKGVLEYDDIVYTTRGTIGNVAYYGDKTPYPHVRINSGMVILRTKQDVVNPLFLYHLLRHKNYRAYVTQYSTGSAQPQLPIKALSKIKLDIPPLAMQNKIASILSAYDDLIENNQKRIKLLEQMAQRLYQEWFVRFRFPGYEKAKFVDGVPKGWRISTIGKLCTLKHQTVSPSNLSTAVPYIGLEHMPRNDFCLSTWGDSSNINSSKYVYHAGNIIFGVIRPYFHKVGFAINDGIVSSDSFVLEPIRAYWGLFLLTVSSNAFVEVISQTCKSGTKMPRADWKQMEKYPVPIAPDEIHNAFENIIGKITQEIKALAFQNKNLAKQRDLLLPRLMSGKLAV